MKHKPFYLAILLSLLLAILITQPASAIHGVWRLTGMMNESRGNGLSVTLLALAGGKVLAAGGVSQSAEVYDPLTEMWSMTGSMAQLRWNHSATLLPDGKVLVAGGLTSGESILASAELYDPATGTWRSAGSMSIARTSHIAVLLANGKVLMSGGFAPPNSESLKDAEVYDPATNTWSPTGAMNARRATFAAARLSNGRVLVAGGFADNLPLVSAEIYDPATGVWTATGAMATSRWAHTLTRLLNGKVLAVGGQSEGSSAEVYDPSTGTWAPTGSTSAFYIFHAATRLPDGKVLVSGGEINEAGASAEVYDPVTGAWAVTSSPGTHPARHKTVLLTNGKVLAAGGSTASAELYISTAAVPLRSVGAQDGWALETSEASNKGGTVNATAPTFALGDDGGNKQFRAILSFNTALLPDNAAITRVVLKIRKQGTVGTNPFTTHGKIAVDIRKGAFSNSAALQSTDFQAGANKPGVAAFVNNPQAGGWYVTSLSRAAFPFVHRGGVTQLRLRFQVDDDNDNTLDFIRFFSGNSIAANRPVLVVEYYVP